LLKGLLIVEQMFCFGKVRGFGIGAPEQAKQVGALADGVIAGSACEDDWRE